MFSILTILSVSAGAQTVSALGTCPGPMDIRVRGLTPNSAYAVVTASAEGSATVPRGGCAGTQLGLAGNGLKVRVVNLADADGAADLAPDIPAQACGSYVQVLDLATCQPSNVVDLSGQVPTSCLDALASGATNTGVYTIDPDGVGGTDPFEAWCDQLTDGGGWTMCYAESDDTIVHVSTETSSTVGYPFDGYRSDCRNVPFTDVLYVNHDTAEMAWFTPQSPGGPWTLDGLGYAASGAATGVLFDAHGAAPVNSYQLNVCDTSWMWVGLMMSGYTGCYKQCGNWCSDTSTAYFRTDGDDDSMGPSYDGIAFSENGHRDVSYKLMSVGIR